jgi:hypothetical protein
MEYFSRCYDYAFNITHNITTATITHQPFFPLLHPAPVYRQMADITLTTVRSRSMVGLIRELHRMDVITDNVFHSGVFQCICDFLTCLEVE